MSMIPELPGAVPEIPVSDIFAATEYYRDKLGFKLDWLEAEIVLAGMSRDQCRLFLAGPAFREARARWRCGTSREGSHRSRISSGRIPCPCTPGLVDLVGSLLQDFRHPLE